jgi:hypothetical protein
MRARWIVAIVVVCCVAFVSVPFIALFLVHAYYDMLVRQEIQKEIDSRPKSVYLHYVTVFLEDNRGYEGLGKPYLVASNFTARDYRGNPPYSLQISGIVGNEGGGIAYNGVLHVVAMNSEGIALNSDYDFTGIPAHSTTGFEFSLHYNSSFPIINCTITPMYTDTWTKDNGTLYRLIP